MVLSAFPKFCINLSLALPAFFERARVTEPDLVSILVKTIADKLEILVATALDADEAASVALLTLLPPAAWLCSSR